MQAPRSSVTAEALQELGVIVITGNNPQDVAEVERIINYIVELGKGAEIEIQLVKLEHSDATSVANTLNQLFSRVNVGPSALTQAPVPRTTTTQQGILGVTSASTSQAASIVLLPLARFNSILVGAPKGRIKQILDEVKRLDVPIPAVGGAEKFPSASAFRVAPLNTFTPSVTKDREPDPHYLRRPDQHGLRPAAL